MYDTMQNNVYPLVHSLVFHMNYKVKSSSIITL